MYRTVNRNFRVSITAEMNRHIIKNVKERLQQRAGTNLFNDDS